MTRDELLERYAAGERDFSGADLCRADLAGANLRRTNMRGANLRGANLLFADLTEANLTKANLWHATLAGANLTGATLINADLTEANLTKANLWHATLAGANLTGATLINADLTGATGLPSPREWLAAHLTRVEGGWVAFKVFGAYYAPSPAWDIRAGSILEEAQFDPDRRMTCAPGINCVTPDWISRNALTSPLPVWRIFIADADIDAGDVCVPYATTGVFRARRVTLIELEGQS